MLIYPRPHYRCVAVALFLLCFAAKLWSSQDSDEITSIRSKTKDLINQLGSEQYALRIEAEEQLSRYLPLIRKELLAASQNEDLEIASRAKTILSKVAEPNFYIRDAMGDPIPFAKVALHGSGTNRELTFFSDDRQSKVEKFEPIDNTMYADSTGGIAIKNFAEGSVEILINHPDYGRGRSIIRFPILKQNIRFPLVASNSKAAGRSLSGTVTNDKGKPISGALIHGFTVRTSGEGLINAIHNSADCLTDTSGQFRYYLPNKPTSERGKLIPPNSNYRIQVSIPGDTQNIPVSGRYNNQKNAVITISLGNRVHKFAFETLDGKSPTEEELNSRYSISFHGTDIRNPAARLDINKAMKGMKLKEGIYTASVTMDGRSVSLQPIRVNENSREKLTFRLPPRVVYRGRVVHGATREPIENAIVMGYDSQGKGSLAALTDKQWATMSKLSAEEIMTDPLIKYLRTIYGIHALTKTNENGEFKINQPPGRQAYGLIALDKDFVPYSMAYYQLLPDQEDPFKTITTVKSLIKDFPLFPAAKVLITPIVDAKKLSKKRVSVMPVWLINPANQPKWVKDHFQTARHYNSGDFKYDHWLQHNEKQAVYVPAGMNLMLMLDTPYNEFVSPTVLEKSIFLKQGEVLDLGKIEFKPSLRAVVTVTDEKGIPIEGLPVRKMDDGTNAWSLVHNTNADGEALFGLNRNTSGKFRVGEQLGGSPVEPVLIDFKVGNNDPAKPYLVQLSADQIKMMRKTKEPSKERP